MSLATIGAIFGVFGSGIGVWNFFANIRTRTVASQAPLLNELATQYENIVSECAEISSMIQFDRLDIASKLPPELVENPAALTKAANELPRLARQIISPSESRILQIQELAETAARQSQYLYTFIHNPERWDQDTRLHNIMANRDGLNAKIDELSIMLTEEIKIVGRINKGSLQTRWLYGDRGGLAKSLFRFPELKS